MEAVANPSFRTHHDVPNPAESVIDLAVERLLLEFLHGQLWMEPLLQAAPQLPRDELRRFIIPLLQPARPLLDVAPGAGLKVQRPVSLRL